MENDDGKTEYAYVSFSIGFDDKRHGKFKSKSHKNIVFVGFFECRYLTLTPVCVPAVRFIHSDGYCTLLLWFHPRNNTYITFRRRLRDDDSELYTVYSCFPAKKKKKKISSADTRPRRFQRLYYWRVWWRNRQKKKKISRFYIHIICIYYKVHGRRVSACPICCYRLFCFCCWSPEGRALGISCSLQWHGVSFWYYP